MSFRGLIGALLAAWTLASAAEAAPFRTPHVETEFHSARAAIAPGERFTIVLRQTIAPGWHTYWRNPGDSGEPTQITAWRLPPGFAAGPIQWPAPEAQPFAILVNYGYSGEVLFPIEIQAPRTLPVGQRVTLSADLYWLVCSDVCIPEEGTLSLTLPIAARASDDRVWAPRVAAAIAALPQDVHAEARISAGEPGRLSIALPNAGAISDAYFFAYNRDATDHVAPQHPSVGARGITFALKSGVDHDIGRRALDGVMTYRTSDGASHAIEVHARPGAALAETSGRSVANTGGAHAAPATSTAQNEPAGEESMSLVVAVLFAFIGGLILNVMPCVLPVLSIKALSLAGGLHAGAARREGAYYLIGVLATFLALALVLITLRSAGAAVGWGFQLQSPLVSAGLALLFFAIGLNLLGVFEINLGQSAGSSLAARSGDVGAFFAGALAVVAATPCTAPFMTGAIGAALTQSNGATLLVFASLGLGFALPLTALAFAPGLQGALPKPGPWMERVRNVLAFPMFGAAVWLAWVLTKQSGAGGALALLSLATALGFAIVAARWGRIWIVIGLLVLALTGALAWKPLAGAEAPSALASEPWSAARVAALRAEGRPVFVNFTADWCVSCKVNEALTFSSPRVARAFAEHNVAYLEADWTRRDAAIAAELAAHGRAGVPLYLYYAPGRDAVVLPQLLTENAVIEAISAGE